MRRLKIATAAFTACLMTGLASFSPAAQLVKDGKAAATIITGNPASRSAQFAVNELQCHVEKITGAKLPITDDPANADGVKIYVGESPATRAMSLKSSEFKNQEYLLRVKGDTIVLMGRDKEDTRRVDYNIHTTFPSIWDEQGTAYAVYDFLEKLGVRWYLPTDIGICFNTSKDLQVGDMEVRRAPFMKCRHVYRGDIPADFAGDTIKGQDVGVLPAREAILWSLRQREGGVMVPNSHSFYSWFTRFLKEHPDYFAQGYDSAQPPQLCYSNPKVVQQAVEDARNYFDGKLDGKIYGSGVPNGLDVVPLTPMDNHDFCKCPDCQAQMNDKAKGAGQYSNGKASDYIYNFVNKVAREISKTHPGKSVSTLAYADYCYPPENIKLEPNVIVGLCLHSRHVYATQVQANDLAIIDAWKTVCPENEKKLWLYYCFPSLTAKREGWRHFPAFFAHRLKEQFKRYVAINSRGVFIEPSYVAANGLRSSALRDQLEIYVTWKLADDPDADADKIIDEFFVKYYGKAAEPMRKLYAAIEEAYCDPKNHPSQKINEEESWRYQGTDARMKEFGALMTEAKTLALADSDAVKRRVEIFDNGVWQYMLKGKQAYIEKEMLTFSTMKQGTAPFVTNKEPGNPLTVDWTQAGMLGAWKGLRAEKIDRNMFARVAHDGKYFYIMLEDNVKTANLQIAEDIYHSDEWELYFAGQRGTPYNCIVMNFKGQSVSLEFSDVAGRHESSMGAKIVSDCKSPDVWRLYAAIPFGKLIPGGLSAGKTLYFNAIRSKQAKAQGCWISTFGGYQEPSRFGEIILGGAQ